MIDPLSELETMLADRLAVLVWWPRPGGLRARVRMLKEGLGAGGVDLQVSSLHGRTIRRPRAETHRAAVLPHLEQVHVDFSCALLERRFAARHWADKVTTACDLVHRACSEEHRPLVLVDHSAGSLEGTPGSGSSVPDPGRPWWLKELAGRWPEEVPSFERLGRGVGVALVDLPPDSSHPALRGKTARPLAAWAMPHYPRPAPVPDDHGTGSAGLVAGWQKGLAPVGPAPAAHLHPVHLWPAASVKGTPDRVRVLCRSLELIRQRQLKPAKWAPIQVVSQQFALRDMRSAAGQATSLDLALRVLEAAYARAAGTWGLAVLVSAGSNPRAVWPVWPSGLAGATAVGATDCDGEFLRRSPRLGVEIAVAVSNRGEGVWSAAAGGGYLAQGQATSSTCPLAAGALAAVISEGKVEPRRALSLIRRRGQILPGGATKVDLSVFF